MASNSNRRKNLSLSFVMIAFFLLGGLTCLAQSIQGVVVDESGKPLVNANVLLLNAKDSSLIKGTVSSEKGTFSFTNKSASTLIITSTFTGYNQAYTAPFTTNLHDVDLGKISLFRTNKELNAITIITKKPFIEQKIDRMVINVKNSITSAGSTALEVLERSPGVFVDRQNNTISLSGKSGVVVMINGKINHMPMDALVQMLGGMNSSNIEKIEFITTPPANFDAEGNAGFINIVLIQNPSFGTNGSYSATLGCGKGETEMASLNFNHRNSKLNLSGDFSFSKVHMPQMFELYRLVNNNAKLYESYSINDRNTYQRNLNGRLGLDFQASKKTLIGLEIAAYDNKWSMDAKNDNIIKIDKVVDTMVNAFDVEINRWIKYGASLNVQHTIRENEKVVFEYNVDHYTDNNPNNYLNSYYDGKGIFLYNQKLNSEKKTPITISVISGDYSKKINKSIDLTAGVKYSTYRFTNDIAVARFIQNAWVTDNDFTAKYFLKEDIPAIYTSLDVALNEKNSIKMGLRYEYTISNLGTEFIKNVVDRRYGKLFPSLFISHKINDNNSINMSYSKRITRPTFRDLAPFVYFLDPNTYISGNSALQPSNSNSANIAYSYKRLLFSISYTDEKEFIAGFQSRIDPVTNKQYLIAENEPDLKTAGLSISIPVAVTKWWNMQNNIGAQWQQVSALYNNQSLTLHQENYNVVSTQTFRLPKDYSFELQGFYSSKRLAGTYVIKAVGALNAGIQKKLSGKKGKLSFNVRDMFNSLSFNTSVNLPAQNLVTDGSYRFSNRTYALTYSRSFGSNSIVTNRNKSSAAAEERARVE